MRHFHQSLAEIKGKCYHAKAGPVHLIQFRHPSPDRQNGRLELSCDCRELSYATGCKLLAVELEFM
jgi:hypothetical protein